jgi:leucyl-tRNA synthetase
MQYLPRNLRATQKGYLEWVQMRPCARRRGIGTPLPYDKSWVIESLSDSTIYQMFYLVISHIKNNKIKAKQLTAEFFDYVFLGKQNPTILSEETGIDEKIIKEIRNDIEYWNNCDFRYTAPPHMSNHLSFLIYHYGIIFPEKNWPKCITVGGLMIRDGAKISKSKGNGLPLIKVREKFGVDLFRLYIAVAANYDVEMDFKDSEIMQLEKKFNRFRELIFSAKNKKLKKYSTYDDLDKWLISKFYSRINGFFENMENLRIREAYNGILYEFLADIAYHERRTNTEKTLNALRFVLEDYIKIMTPVIPHFCEEINSHLNKNMVSLQAFTTDSDKFINKEIEDIENINQDLISRIAKFKETRNIVVIDKITIVQANDDMFKLFDTLKNILSKTKDFKTVFGELNSKFGEYKKFIAKFVPKTLGEGLSSYLDKKDEKKLMNEIKSFIEKEFNTKIEIVDAKSIKDFNQTSAIPGKPGIIIE